MKENLRYRKVRKTRKLEKQENYMYRKILYNAKLEILENLK